MVVYIALIHLELADIFLRTFLSCQVSTPVPLREYHLPSLEISASAYVWHYQFPIAHNLVYLA